MGTILSWARWGRRLNRLSRLGLTLGFISLVTLVRWSWADYLQSFLFVLGYPVVLLSTFLFGWAFGLVGIALSAVVVTFFFVEPLFSLHPAEPHQVAGVITYLVGGLLAISLVESLARTIERLERAHCEARTLLQTREALLREKDLLLRELNHRVKNNLQAVNAMFAIHRAKLSHEEARDALAAAGERIAVVGRIHDRLYQQTDPSATAMTLKADELLGELCAELRRALADERPITFTLEVEPIPMSVGRATLIGLLVNELVTNALKYAFPGDRPGTLTVRLWRCSDELLCLIVADDGVGCPETHADGIGLTLVEALAAQLRGTVRRDDANSGCRITLDIPFQEPPH